MIKKCWYPMKGLVTKNMHVKYQSFSTQVLKLLARLQFKKKRVKLKGQGNKVKSVGTHRKVLSPKNSCEISKSSTLALTVHKLLVKLKFFLKGSNSRVKVNRLVPTERSCHKEYPCEISKP